MFCIMCESDSPTAGCPVCGLRQPTLFSVSAPPQPDEHRFAQRVLRDRLLFQQAVRTSGRDAALRALARPLRVGLLAASKRHSIAEGPARTFYFGDFFRGALAIAEQFADEVYVLSATHGLIDLATILEPGGRPAHKMPHSARAEWGDRVTWQLRERFGDLHLVLIGLVGSDMSGPLAYVRLRDRWILQRPLDGLPYTKHRAWLKTQRGILERASRTLAKSQAST